MFTAATAYLRFVRSGSGYADRLRRYKLFVNGAQVGIIGSGEVVDVDVPSGPLTIQGRIDWCASQPLQFEAAPGERIAIEIANNWGALLAIWAITFRPGTYLALRRIDA